MMHYIVINLSLCMYVLAPSFLCLEGLRGTSAAVTPPRKRLSDLFGFTSGFV